MQDLSYSFMLFKCCGFWRPKNLSQRWKIIIYNFYSIIMVSFVYIFVFLQFINLIDSFGDIERLINVAFMTLSLMIVCGKIANLINKREMIIELMNVLQNDICNPRDSIEIQIQNECDRNARFNTMWYGVLSWTAVLTRTMRSVIIDIPERDLPFKVWLPYECDKSLIGFWIAYLHQTVSHFACATLNVGYDTLVSGLLMQACSQIQILKHRLDEISKILNEKKDKLNGDYRDYRKESQLLESKLIAESVRHHLEIFQFAEKSNDIFGLLVFFQYSISSVVICFCSYEVSKTKIFSSEFNANMLFLSCMLVQIFNFCFYGGEIMLQSLEICDAVYRMEWWSFSNATKKSLVTIMLRSLQPITFTCGSFITLSLDSFSSLIKLSYSTYNVLQQSR